MSIIIPKQLNDIKDLVVADEIWDYVSPSEVFNYFTDTPDSKKIKDPFQEFAHLCMTNLGWAAKTIIGRGNFELLPFQCSILELLWNKTFPLLLMTRGGGKTTLLALYAVLRAVLDQNSSNGSKIVIVAGSFRQSKLIMEQIEGWYKDSPILQECSEIPEGLRRGADKWEFAFGKSTIVALPLGDGQRIRGVRANYILVDEVSTVPEETFNVVIRGFGAVSQNPVEKVRFEMRRRQMMKSGMAEEDIPEKIAGNQIVRSGTATYHFNHFYKIYEQHKKILDNKIKGYGSDKKIRDVLGNNLEPADYFNYKDYAVIQIPYEALPEGYMDKTMVMSARLDMSKDQFLMEYGAKFVTDSNGFYKASALERATPNPEDPLYFDLELKGDGKSIYVMGIDPARKSDWFSLVIIKISGATHKIVYVWQWNKKNFGIITPEIRRLQKAFNVTRIGIDQGGGGTSVMDFLQTKEMIPEGELPYWEIDSKDIAPGLKILDMINYMGSWLKSANYDMCADIENRRLLFPYHVPKNFTEISKDFDKLEEIFELTKETKKQLTQIEVTATDKTEQEHFDVAEESKWVQHKDLYSALLIAAYEARQTKQKEIRTVKMSEESIGGSIEEFSQ